MTREHKMKQAYCYVLLLIGLASCSNMTLSQGRHRAIRAMNEGVMAFQQGNFSDATKLFELAMKEDDGYMAAHYNVAKLYQKMERWEDAQKQLIRVTTEEPKNGVAHYDLGVCYQMLGQLDRAKSAYERALSLDDRLYKAHYRVGVIAQIEDRPKDADAAYRRAIAINPQFVRPLVKMGQLYLNYDYPEVAKQVLATAVAIDPKNGEAYNFLGVAYQRLKDYPAAIQNFQRTLQLKSDSYSAMYNLGITYAAADQRDEAEKILDRFAKMAAGKKDIDQEFVQAARDKIAELHGVPRGTQVD